MNTNWFLAILVEKKVLDEGTATELAHRLDNTTYSHDFVDALEDIQKLFKEIDAEQLQFLTVYI